MAITGLNLRGIIAAARFGIHENCSHYGFQVAAYAAAVVIEDLGYARDVVGTWIAGDEFLNELFRDEGANVGVGENILDGGIEIGLNGAACRQGDAVEKRFRTLIVMSVIREHRSAEKGAVVELRFLPGRWGIRPSGKDVGESFDGVLGIGGNWIAG